MFVSRYMQHYYLEKHVSFYDTSSQMHVCSHSSVDTHTSSVEISIITMREFACTGVMYTTTALKLSKTILQDDDQR